MRFGKSIAPVSNGAQSNTAEDEGYGLDGELLVIDAYDRERFDGLGLRVVGAANGRVVHRTNGDDSEPFWRPR
jgi:hypothetical protein